MRSCLRTTLMNFFDPLQMLTLYSFKVCFLSLFSLTTFSVDSVMHFTPCLSFPPSSRSFCLLSVCLGKFFDMAWDKNRFFFLTSHFICLATECHPSNPPSGFADIRILYFYSYILVCNASYLYNRAVTTPKTSRKCWHVLCASSLPCRFVLLHIGYYSPLNADDAHL